MNIPLLAVLAVLAGPARATAVCAPHAALLKMSYRLSYERPDGPSRLVMLDKSECASFIRDAGVSDFDGPSGAPSEPEPRLRYWSANSPYEIHVELAGGWAVVTLVKRDGPYTKVMARLDRVEDKELTATAIDYLGDVADGEQPELRVSPGLRRISRAARVILTPFKR